MIEWIEIKEPLPEPSEEVLFYVPCEPSCKIKSGRFHKGDYRSEHAFFTEALWKWNIKYVTHWAKTNKPDYIK